MLSAVPFKAENVLFIILFGATQQCITTELGVLDTSSLGVVFIHITDMDLRQLVSVMRNHVSSLGLGPHHSYVRPHPCGPCPTSFPGNEDNYLRTIGGAVTDYLRLSPRQSTDFAINLSAILEELIRYVRSGSQTALDPLVQEPTNDYKFEPVQHLSIQQQSYVEFITLLQAAADKQQEELRLADAVLLLKDDMMPPIYCFDGTTKLATWVQERISPEPKILHRRERVLLDPRTNRNSPRGNTYSTGGDLASKKRKLDLECVSMSFYGGGDEIGDI